MAAQKRGQNRNKTMTLHAQQLTEPFDWPNES